MNSLVNVNSCACRQQQIWELYLQTDSRLTSYCCNCLRLVINLLPSPKQPFQSSLHAVTVRLVSNHSFLFCDSRIMKCPLNYNQAGFELHCILMWDWLLFAIIKHCTLKLPINRVNAVISSVRFGFMN